MTGKSQSIWKRFDLLSRSCEAVIKMVKGADDIVTSGQDDFRKSPLIQGCGLKRETMYEIERRMKKANL